MAFARTESFPKKETELADLLKALSHPARIAILKAVAKKEGCICGDLVGDLPIAQATISQHLKILKDSGLIKGRIDGPRTCYCIDWKVYNRLSASLKGVLEFVDQFKNNSPKKEEC